MGKIFSTRKDKKESATAPSKPVEPEDPGLQRIRRSLDENLEIFLLNNMLLSVQFFENFER